MNQKMNLRNYEKVTGKNPWDEIRYRTAANFITAVPSSREEDIFSDFVRMNLKKDRKTEELNLIDAAVTNLFYNPPKAFFVHGITKELINYAALSAPSYDEHSKKVYAAIIEEIEASPAGVTVSEKSIEEYLQMFAGQMKKSMEKIQYEFNPVIRIKAMSDHARVDTVYKIKLKG
ncbi:MAG: hypothetical protein WA139_05270 [Candidatus Aenigmatarchaeota archaeon]